MRLAEGSIRLSWQIVPIVLPTMLSDPNPARAERVLQAVMRMQKLDLNALEEAFGRDNGDHDR